MRKLATLVAAAAVAASLAGCSDDSDTGSEKAEDAETVDVHVLVVVADAISLTDDAVGEPTVCSEVQKRAGADKDIELHDAAGDVVDSAPLADPPDAATEIDTPKGVCIWGAEMEAPRDKGPFVASLAGVDSELIGESPEKIALRISIGPN